MAFVQNTHCQSDFPAEKNRPRCGVRACSIMGRTKSHYRHQQNGRQIKHRTRWAGRLWLVLVDDAPLREDAARQCRHSFAQLTKKREEWSRFERHDRPAFERWRAATFGAELTELRQTTERLEEYDRLILAVESESFFGRCSMRTAYQRIMRARRKAEQSPAGEPPPSQRDGAFQTDAADPLADDDFSDAFEPGMIDEQLKTELFRDFLGNGLGVDPDSLPSDLYEEMFEAFKAELGDSPGESSSQREGDSFPWSARDRAKPARLKTLYRELARRLHPDTRAESGPHTIELWHEVQEAYASEDLERMETLQALTDICEQKIRSQTALSRLRAALAEIDGALHVLNKSLRSARQDPAWNFSKIGLEPALKSRLERDLARQLQKAKEDLVRKEALIALWESAPASKKKTKRAAPAINEARFAGSEQTWMQF